MDAPGWDLRDGVARGIDTEGKARVGNGVTTALGQGGGAGRGRGWRLRLQTGPVLAGLATKRRGVRDVGGSWSDLLLSSRADGCPRARDPKPRDAEASTAQY